MVETTCTPHLMFHYAKKIQLKRCRNQIKQNTKMVETTSTPAESSRACAHTNKHKCYGDNLNLVLQIQNDLAELRQKGQGRAQKDLHNVLEPLLARGDAGVDLANLRAGK